MVLGSNAAAQILAAQQAGVMQNHAYAQSLAQHQMNPMGGFEASQMSAPSGMHMGFGMGAAAHHQAPALMRSAVGAGQAGMFGLSIAAAFNLAPRVFDPFTSTIHSATMGWQGAGLAGGSKMAGAIGAGAMTAGAYLAVGSAASWMTRNIMQGAQQQVHLANTVQGGYGMSGMNMGQMNVPLANNLANQAMPMITQAGQMGLGNLVNAGSVSNIMGMGMASGAFRGVNSAAGFKKVLNRLTAEALQMSSLLKSSIEDARGTLDTMNRQFGMGAGEAMATIGGMGAVMPATGMGVQQQMGFAQFGTQVYQGLGLSRVQGARYGLGLGQRVGIAATSGFLDKETLRDVGGAQNFTTRLTQAGMRIFSGARGMRLLGAMMTPDGELDADMAQRIASGAATREEINKAYRANVKGQSGRGALLANIGELIGDFMSQYGTGGAVTGLGSLFANRKDSAWQMQAATGLQGNELQLLKGMSGANPMIQQKLRDAAQSGINDSGLQGKSIGDIVDTMVSKLIGPMRDKFRSIGRDISAGISEATDELGRNLLGKGPAMHRAAPGRGGLSGMRFAQRWGVPSIAQRGFGAGARLHTAWQQGMGAFNAATPGVDFSPGGMIDQGWQAGGMSPASSWIPEWLGGGEEMGGSMAEDLPTFAGGMGGFGGFGGDVGFGSSWGYGTDVGYGDLTDFGRNRPGGAAGFVSKFIPDAFRAAAQGEDPWDMPNFGMTGAPGWSGLGRAFLFEGAAGAVLGGMSRGMRGMGSFNLWRAGRPGGGGIGGAAWNRAMRWDAWGGAFGRASGFRPIGSTLSWAGAQATRAGGAVLGGVQRAFPRATAAAARFGSWAFGAGGGLTGLGPIRGSLAFAKGASKLGMGALGGLSKFAGRIAYPLMALDAIMNYEHYQGTAGLQDVRGGITGVGADLIGMGTSFGLNQNLGQAAPNSVPGFRGYGGTLQYETGSVMSEDWDRNTLGGFIGQFAFGGWWGNDPGGWQQTIGEGGFIPVEGYGRTRTGRTESEVDGLWSSWGSVFSSDNYQIEARAIHRTSLQNMMTTLQEAGRPSDIARRWEQTQIDMYGGVSRVRSLGAMPEDLGINQDPARFLEGQRGVARALRTQVYNDNMMFGSRPEGHVGERWGVPRYVHNNTRANTRIYSRAGGRTRQLVQEYAREAFRSNIRPTGDYKYALFSGMLDNSFSEATPMKAETRIVSSLANIYAYGMASHHTYLNSNSEAERDAALKNMVMIGMLTKGEADKEGEMGRDWVGGQAKAPWEAPGLGINRPGVEGDDFSQTRFRLAQSLIESGAPGMGYAGAKELLHELSGTDANLRSFHPSMKASEFRRWKERSMTSLNRVLRAQVDKAAEDPGSTSYLVTGTSLQEGSTEAANEMTLKRIRRALPKHNIPAGDETVGGQVAAWLGMRSPYELGFIAENPESLAEGSTLWNNLVEHISTRTDTVAQNDMWSSTSPHAETLRAWVRAGAAVDVVHAQEADVMQSRKEKGARYTKYREWQQQTGVSSVGKLVASLGYSGGGKWSKLLDEMMETDDTTKGLTQFDISQFDKLIAEASPEAALEMARNLKALGSRLGNSDLEHLAFRLTNSGSYKSRNEQVRKKYGTETSRNMPTTVKMKELYEAFGSPTELAEYFGIGKTDRAKFQRDYFKNRKLLGTALQQKLKSYFSSTAATIGMQPAEAIKHVETLLQYGADTDGSGVIQEGKGFMGTTPDAEGRQIEDTDNPEVMRAIASLGVLSSLGESSGAGGAQQGGAGQIQALVAKLPALNTAIDQFIVNLKEKKN